MNLTGLIGRRFVLIDGKKYEVHTYNENGRCGLCVGRHNYAGLCYKLPNCNTKYFTEWKD